MAFTERPGLAVSSTVHVALLAVAILSFSRAPKFQDAQETVPVELVTSQDLNDIMRGDKTAKTVQPTPRADKVADTADTKPQPPVAEAKRDVPTPPPPLKRNPDPGESDQQEQPKPPEKVAALPPPRPDVTPPQPPVDKPQPQMEKPPEDAEAIEPPKPVPRPKIEPPKVEPPKEEPKKPERLKLDEVAKLLDTDKHKDVPKPVERPVAKPKSGEETSEPQHKLNLADISKLLSHEAPERKASTNRTLAQTASLGSPTANAPRMSPSLEAQMEGWFQDRFQGCWTPPLTQPSGAKYVPMVRAPLNLDGSLAGEPVLVNPPSDPAWRPLAESAVRAIRKCNPLPVPDRFKPYYEEWRSRIVRFDAEML
jgi:hypothetical protein